MKINGMFIATQALKAGASALLGGLAGKAVYTATEDKTIATLLGLVVSGSSYGATTLLEHAIASMTEESDEFEFIEDSDQQGEQEATHSVQSDNNSKIAEQVSAIVNAKNMCHVDKFSALSRLLLSTPGLTQQESELLTAAINANIDAVANMTHEEIEADRKLRASRR